MVTLIIGLLKHGYCHKTEIFGSTSWVIAFKWGCTGTLNE